jgi:hypothetical protein
MDNGVRAVAVCFCMPGKAAKPAFLFYEPLANLPIAYL